MEQSTSAPKNLQKKTQKKSKKATKKTIKNIVVNSVGDMFRVDDNLQFKVIQSLDEKTLDKIIKECEEFIKNNNTTRVIRYNNLLDMIFTIYPNKNIFTQKPIEQENQPSIIVKPDIRDPEFQTKINMKKEFMIYKNKAPLDSIENNDEYKGKKLDVILDEEIEKKCGKFELTATQKFLKRFLNSRNPYRSMLLFHGTGVGKSCSAVSIAEGFLPELKKISKKVYVLLNPSVKESFRKNIFLKLKLDGEEDDVYEQCTRDTYLKNINLSNTSRNRPKIKKLIDQQINSSYEFMGYLQFANMVDKKIISKINKRTDLSPKEKLDRVKKGIQQLFSDSVIIIDEVHNIKQQTNSGKDDKKITKVLEDVIRYAENLKLILLTATPMFDVPNEIVYILNLLLLNERRGKIDEKQFFRNNKLLDDKLELFRYKTQGLVSYVRGENPIFFPVKLYPKNVIKMNAMPTKTSSKGQIIEIPETKRITKLQLVPAVMGKIQQSVYDKVALEEKDSFRLATLSCSNVVFPSLDEETKTKYGNTGFNSCFKKIGEGVGNRSLKYKPVEGFDFDNFVDSIQQYSGKIKAIIDNIKKSTGVVFIYSKFLWSGIIPIAFCLEKLGFNRYGTGGNLLDDIVPNNKLKRADGSNPRYIIITGEQAFDSDSIYKKYLEIEKDNADGSQVKVIFGTESAAEGLDFKMMREIHILEPFFHLSKNDQVIGRGIRRCSHKALDFKDRNVTVYQYSGVTHGEKGDNPYTETVDLQLYRDAEQKDKNVAKVTYELKKNSVDCEINYSINTFLDKKWSEAVEMRDSKGEVRKITLGNFNKDYERECNYEKCDYKCYGQSSDKLDDSTFQYPEDILDLIFEVQESVITILKKNNAINLDDLLRHNLIMKLNIKNDKELLYYALDDLITSKRVIKNEFNIKCIVNRFENLYVLLPMSMKDMSPTLLEMITNKVNKYGKLELDINKIIKMNMTETDEKEQQKQTDQEDESIQQTVDNINDGVKLNELYTLTIPVMNKLCERSIVNKDENKNLYAKLKKLNFIMDKDDHPTGYFTIDKNNEVVFKYLNTETKRFNTHKNGEEYYNLANTEYKIKMRNKNAPKLIAYFEYDIKKNKTNFKIKDNRETDKSETRRKKRGTVCLTSGMDNIVDYYNGISGNTGNSKETTQTLLENVTRGKKELLCAKLTDAFIKKNNEDKTKPVLFSIIDTILFL